MIKSEGLPSVAVDIHYIYIMVCEDSDIFILQDKIILNISNMKEIIINSMANSDIQFCLVTDCGVEIIFHNNDLADKFVKSLTLPYIKDNNKVTITQLGRV